MIQKDFNFFKISSGLVKIAAWTFLLFGVLHGIGVLISVEGPRWLGLFYIVLYVFGFFLIYLIAQMADLLLEVLQFLKKERF